MENPSIPELEEQLMTHRAHQLYDSIAAVALSVTSSIPVLRSAIEGTSSFRGVSEMVVTAIGLGIAGLYARQSIVEENSGDAIQRALSHQNPNV
jgi:hypothetical protein